MKHAIKLFLALAIFFLWHCILVEKSYTQTSAQQVTAVEYCDFLNHVAASDTNHLYDEAMGKDPSSGCIARVSAHGSYHYFVFAGKENFPITYVNFFDEARYCNWLENGQPSAEQYPTCTEEGAYDLNGIDDVATNEKKFKNPNATHWITDNEKNDNPCLRSSQRDFSVVGLGTVTLPLAIAPVVNSTSSSSSYWKDVAEVAGVIGLAAFGSVGMLGGEGEVMNPPNHEQPIFINEEVAIQPCQADLAIRVINVPEDETVFAPKLAPRLPQKHWDEYMKQRYYATNARAAILEKINCLSKGNYLRTTKYLDRPSMKFAYNELWILLQAKERAIDTFCVRRDYYKQICTLRDEAKKAQDNMRSQFGEDKDFQHGSELQDQTNQALWALLAEINDPSYKAQFSRVPYDPDNPWNSFLDKINYCKQNAHNDVVTISESCNFKKWQTFFKHLEHFDPNMDWSSSEIVWDDFVDQVNTIYSMLHDFNTTATTADFVAYINDSYIGLPFNQHDNNKFSNDFIDRIYVVRAYHDENDIDDFSWEDFLGEADTRWSKIHELQLKAADFWRKFSLQHDNKHINDFLKLQKKVENEAKRFFEAYYSTNSAAELSVFESDTARALQAFTKQNKEAEFKETTDPIISILHEEAALDAARKALFEHFRINGRFKTPDREKIIDHLSGIDESIFSSKLNNEELFKILSNNKAAKK